jgi:hypothetical protein
MRALSVVLRAVSRRLDPNQPIIMGAMNDFDEL